MFFFWYLVLPCAPIILNILISSNLYQTSEPCPCVWSTSSILERLSIGEPRSSSWVIRMSVHRSKNRTHQVIMLIFFQVEIHFALISCWIPVKWFNRPNSDAAEHPKCMLSAPLVNQCFYAIGLGKLITFDTFISISGELKLLNLAMRGFQLHIFCPISQFLHLRRRSMLPFLLNRPIRALSYE